MVSTRCDKYVGVHMKMSGKGFREQQPEDDHLGHVRQDIYTERASHMTQMGQYKQIQEWETHDITIRVVVNVGVVANNARRD
jgi:hypothetical protein